MKKRAIKTIIPFLAAVLIAVVIYINETPNQNLTLAEVPEFSGEPYVVINDNLPQFNDEDLTTNAYEFYSDLDVYGRCGYAMACIGRELMPTEERGSIGQVLQFQKTLTLYQKLQQHMQQLKDGLMVHYIQHLKSAK